MPGSTFSETALATRDTTSIAWARAYARFAMRDIPNTAGAFPLGSLSDAIIDAMLEDDAVTDAVADGGDGTKYYRPHLTAARLIVSNPDRVKAFQESGYSETPQAPATIAIRVRKAGRWITDAILDATDKRVGGTSLTVVL